MEILKTINLKKTYKSGEIEVRALERINLSIQAGEFISVIGASGSGKSTLLKILGGLDNPTEGEVMIRDNRLSDMTENELTIFRRRNIGFVFQHYNLLDTLNVYDNIIFPIRLDNGVVEQKFIASVAAALGINEKLSQMPDQLSGGQQQRVAIARALITKPAIILADEPTGNLDSRTSTEVIELFQKMAQEFKQTMVIVTHDSRVADMADRIVCIEDGKMYNERCL